MKRLLIFAALLIFIWTATAPLVWANDAASPQNCWLFQEGRWGEFTIKFYLTDQNQDVLAAEKIKRLHPDGLYGQTVDVSQETRRRMAIRTKPYHIHMEVWRQGLVDLFSRSGLILGYPDFGMAVIKQEDYPVRDCVTQSMFIDIQAHGTSGITGRNIMMTVCPKEERLATYWVNCADEKIYTQVAGDPNDEFTRGDGVEGAPPLRHVCDRSLERFEAQTKSRQILSSPVRRLIFDETQKAWRTDKVGEFPRFYFNQITLMLNRFGLSFETAPPVRANRGEIEASGKALIAEIVADKETFIKKTHQELAFITYCLIMMGVPEKEVKKFFTSMATDYAHAKGSLDLGPEKPDQIFNTISAAGRQFNPIEKDIPYRRP